MGAKTGSNHMRVLALLPHIAIAILTALLLPVSIAQNETYTNTTTTIRLPTVTIPQVYQVSVSAWYVDASTIQVRVSCYTMNGTCPTVNITVGSNGTVLTTTTVTLSGCKPACSKTLTIGVPTPVAWVYYSYPSGSGNISIRYTPLPREGPVAYVLTLLPFAIAAAFLARSDVRIAGVGGIVAGIVLYAMSYAGLVEGKIAYPIAYISVLVGGILLWMAR